MSRSDVVFAGYRLEQRIMVDTVSATYRAISQLRSGSHRPVALRITEPLDAPDDARVAAAFFALLNRAAAVRHPALPVIRGAGEAGGRLYVATDLIAGVTLAEYLHNQGPLPAAAAVAVLLPIADALDHAHAAGLVHGALSPRTIQLPRHGAGSELPAAILTGFGLETLLAHRFRADRNDIDVLDVCYVAPEQLRGSWFYEPRGGPAPPANDHGADGGAGGPADQYALACALYHCVAGRPPFVHDTVAAMFGAHLFGTARVPAGRDGDGALAAALAAGMAKHPEDRHPSCLALVRAAEYGTPMDRRVPVGPGGATGSGPRLAGGPPPQRAALARPAPPVAQGARRRRDVRRRRSRRLPIAWPIAVMLVLAGMVFTLLLAAILDGGGLVDLMGATPVRGHMPAGAVVPGGGGSAASGGANWVRALGAGPITHLRASSGGVVAATGDTVLALEPGDGAVRWQARTRSGELTDVVVSGRTVGVRAVRLRGRSLRDGALRWEHIDVLTPLRPLAVVDDIVYGIRQRRIGAELVAVDSDNGRELWRFDGGPVQIDADAVVGASADVVAVLQRGRLFVVDARAVTGAGTRAIRWHVEVTRPWRALLVLSDVVVMATRDGRVCAHGVVDGAERWCAQVEGLRDREPVVTAAGDVIAVVTPSRVTGLARESGAQRWVYDAPHELAPVATTSRDGVIVVDGTGTMRGLEVGRGQQRWWASGLGRVTALAADDDAVYAGTRDGRVVRIRPDRVRRRS